MNGHTNGKGKSLSIDYKRQCEALQECADRRLPSHFLVDNIDDTQLTRKLDALERSSYELAQSFTSTNKELAERLVIELLSTSRRDYGHLVLKMKTIHRGIQSIIMRILVMELLNNAWFGLETTTVTVLQGILQRMSLVSPDAAQLWSGVLYRLSIEAQDPAEFESRKVDIMDKIQHALHVTFDKESKCMTCLTDLTNLAIELVCTFNSLPTALIWTFDDNLEVHMDDEEIYEHEDDSLGFEKMVQYFPGAYKKDAIDSYGLPIQTTWRYKSNFRTRPLIERVVHGENLGSFEMELSGNACVRVDVEHSAELEASTSVYCTRSITPTLTLNTQEKDLDFLVDSDPDRALQNREPEHLQFGADAQMLERGSIDHENEAISANDKTLDTVMTTELHQDI